MRGRVPRVLSAAPAVETLVSQPPGDCPRQLLGNKGAGRGRRAQGTQNRKEGTAHLPEAPEGGGPGAVGNQSAERSTGSWSIKEDTLELSPALRGMGLGRVTVLSGLGNERLQDCQNQRNCPCFGPGSQELSFIHST